jgi:ubiquinone/menaquinone biosynthesis C-methylase UbiE
MPRRQVSWVVTALGACWIAAASAVCAQDNATDPQGDAAHGAPLVYMGRTIAPPMSFSGAAWLVRNTREAEENPARLLRALKLEDGQAVCDFGCGNGYYTLQLARIVGARGVVYAVDIQPEMLELLAERAEPRGLDNIKPVLAEPDDPGLPKSTFDLVLMVDVYHELSDPPAVLATVRASLKPSGRLAVVEFREEDPDVPILPLHKMSQQQVMREIPPNGFKLVGQFDGLPWQHVQFFARDDSPLGERELKPWRNRTEAAARSLHPEGTLPAAADSNAR